MYHGRTCSAGRHVLWMAYLRGGCVLLEDMSYRKVGILVGMPYRRAYCTGVCVILENTFYGRTGFTGKYILLEGISYIRASLIGEHVLQVNMLCGCTCFNINELFQFYCGHVFLDDIFNVSICLMGDHAI